MNIIKIHDRLFEPFILNDQIQKRVKLIAEEISKEYEYKNPLFLAVLNGAFMLAADLLREIQFQSEISFVKISSYQGTKSTDSIKELIGFTESLTDRDVINIGIIICHFFSFYTRITAKKYVTQEKISKPNRSFFSFKSTLNPKHPLFILANIINWQLFEDAFEPLYCKDNGRPGKPIRLMVGLLMLKHIRNVSDESVVE
jgi:IS5 family transposase